MKIPLSVGAESGRALLGPTPSLVPQPLVLPSCIETIKRLELTMCASLTDVCELANKRLDQVTAAVNSKLVTLEQAVDEQIKITIADQEIKAKQFAIEQVRQDWKPSSEGDRSRKCGHVIVTAWI